MSTTFADRGEITSLFERAVSQSIQVDSELGVIYGVRVINQESANNRVYTREALGNAKPFYEGCPVHFDHPSSGANGPRETQSRVGWLEHVREAGNGLAADLHVLKDHPYGPMLLEAASRRPELFSLSHNAEGRIVKRDGRNVVEEITRVRSVDVVTDGATTRSLSESRSIYTMMTNAEFAERLFENDGGSFDPPRTDPVDRIPAAGDGPKILDAEMVLQRAKNITNAASEPGPMFRQLHELEEEWRGVSSVAGPELATAAESVDSSYAFASAITENVRGSRSPAGRDPAASFAAAILG